MSLRPRDDAFKPEPRDVNCILLSGGVGDHMGSLVAVDYILKTYPWVNLLIWVPDFLKDFAKNVLPPNANVRNFTEMKTQYDRNKTTIHTEWDGRTSPMKIHSVDYAFLRLCDENPPIHKKNYLKVKFNEVSLAGIELPEKYVVIPTGYTAPVREFKPKAINEVAEYVISKGFTPVFLGQREIQTGVKHIIKGTFNSEVDYTKGIDLRDKTTLLQAAKVIQGARAIIGVDCGLLHVAGCTDTTIIGGFTTVSPELRAPIRNNQLGYNFYSVVPGALLQCRFCQSNTNFLYGHDYTKCMYKDYKCVEELTSDKFISYLSKLL